MGHGFFLCRSIVYGMICGDRLLQMDWMKHFLPSFPPSDFLAFLPSCLPAFLFGYILWPLILYIYPTDVSFTYLHTRE